MTHLALHTNTHDRRVIMMFCMIALVQVFNSHTPIYNPHLRMGDFYNTSVQSDQMRCLDETMGCFPQPFVKRHIPAAPPGYTVVIDASVTGASAQQVLSQLVYGGFMDEMTRSATNQVCAEQVLSRTDSLWSPAC